MIAFSSHDHVFETRPRNFMWTVDKLASTDGVVCRLFITIVAAIADGQAQA